MSATATAKRRRTQARNKGVKHRRIRGDKPHLAVRIASARMATRKK